MGSFETVRSTCHRLNERRIHGYFARWERDEDTNDRAGVKHGYCFSDELWCGVNEGNAEQARIVEVVEECPVTSSGKQVEISDCHCSMITAF